MDEISNVWDVFERTSLAGTVINTLIGVDCQTTFIFLKFQPVTGFSFEIQAMKTIHVDQKPLFHHLGFSGFIENCRLVGIQVWCLGLLVVLFLGSTVSAQTTRSKPTAFPTRELAEFHKALSPLVKQALPNKDFGRIRRGTPTLSRLRTKILQSPLPPVRSEEEPGIHELLSFLDEATSDLVRVVNERGSNDDVKEALLAIQLEFDDLVDAINSAKE